MPEIAELKEFDGAVWARVPVTGTEGRVQILSDAEIDANSAKLDQLLSEIERLTAERDRWHADAARLSAGLTAITMAPKTVGSSVLRSVAYDIAMNSIDGETAEFQIRRRGGLERANQQSTTHECETCRDDPMVCASVPGLRHCEKANR